ncbi:MAG: Rpn family recombination-promoting nuclease/putative transposase [Treponema sp.]|nr:Rpn family recombination-promoting nuclease/putative transposase [Treponema sp.]
MSNYDYQQKKIEDLTFTDDGMFQAVLHEEDICAEIIERLLHVKVSHVEYPELEKQIAPFYTTKGVRLDVYLKDEDKIIDIEIQCYRQPALGKRTRYYQSMIDIDSLMKGQPYPELKESYILFICKNDPFENYGLPCYTFHNTCEENPLVNLNDKCIKVIYNASAYAEEKDEQVRDFLHYVLTDDAGDDDFTNRLEAIVERLKDDEKFRSDYAAMNLHDWDLTRRAKEAGAEEKAIEAATNALKMNLSPEQISKITGLSVEKILELQKEITVIA